MKWKYQILTVTMAQRPSLAGTLANYGNANWELVSVISEELDAAGQVLTLIFKQPG